MIDRDERLAEGQKRWGAANTEDTFKCDQCGDTEREGLKTVHGDKWLCEACAKKLENADEYTYLAPCDRCGAVTSHNRRTGMCLACGVEKDKGHKVKNSSNEICPNCKAKGTMKESEETKDAFWFKCSECGRSMSVPKD